MFHITYDYKKEKANVKKHGLSFEEVYALDLGSGITIPDDRKDYGEERYLWIGMYKDKLHVFCFTTREHVIRAISFRRAREKERKKYEKIKKTQAAD